MKTSDVVLGWSLFALAMLTSSPVVGQQAAPGGVTPQVVAALPKLSVGDSWKYERRDKRTNVKEAEWTQQVISVSSSRIETTDGLAKPSIWTGDFNLVSSSFLTITDGENKRLVFPMEVGRKWAFKYDFTNSNGVKARWQLDAEVAAFEKVTVPAGEFDAFRIEYRGNYDNYGTNRTGRLRWTSWFSPRARNFVRTEFDDGYNYWKQDLLELLLKE